MVFEKVTEKLAGRFRSDSLALEHEGGVISQAIKQWKALEKGHTWGTQRKEKPMIDKLVMAVVLVDMEVPVSLGDGWRTSSS